ncbi:hypothetical protein [Paenibacillus sp. Leaf72]|uniref:hypothetical protein n=1 Tax=Paenibacillus sp. Leaf72 TaxID=1736234 RepID=UPI000A441AD5|nr:hypothetical protein [Paenibacillus sp. Leaf72]
MRQTPALAPKSYSRTGQIHSIYAPAEHPYGTVHKTADDAYRAELTELLEDDD